MNKSGNLPQLGLWSLSTYRLGHIWMNPSVVNCHPVSWGRHFPGATLKNWDIFVHVKNYNKKVLTKTIRFKPYTVW